MGASLLAIAMQLATSMSNVSPSSRAGSLPQGSTSFQKSAVRPPAFSVVRLARTCAVRRRRTRRSGG
ncbi:hypothetical protein FPT12_07435 [Pseudomonas sp. H3(2019)]|nr:hypothetical protein FPT12_07435 [Pseudomonas sp. H3(2019)]